MIGDSEPSSMKFPPGRRDSFQSSSSPLTADCASKENQTGSNFPATSQIRIDRSTQDFSERRSPVENLFDPGSGAAAHGSKGVLRPRGVFSLRLGGKNSHSRIKSGKGGLMLTDQWETILEIISRTGNTPEAVSAFLADAFRYRQAEVRMGYRDGTKVTEIRKEQRKES